MAGEEDELLTAARRLEADLQSLDLSYPSSAGRAARAVQTELIRRLDDDILPRLTRERPLALITVSGPTGAGRSTLVNSIIGFPVSPVSPLRPTTRQPVAVGAPDAITAFGRGPLAGGCELVARDGLPSLQLLVDVPDPATAAAAVREHSLRLIRSADVRVFATSALRYGDAGGAEFIARAAAEGGPVAVVVLRVPDGAAGQIREDLRDRLAQAGVVRDVPLFMIPEALTQQAAGAHARSEELRDWLAEVAGPGPVVGLMRHGVERAVAALREALGRLAVDVERVDSEIQELTERTETIWQNLSRHEYGRLDEAARAASSAPGPAPATAPARPEAPAAQDLPGFPALASAWVQAAKPVEAATRRRRRRTRLDLAALDQAIADLAAELLARVRADVVARVGAWWRSPDAPDGASALWDKLAASGALAAGREVQAQDADQATAWREDVREAVAGRLGDRRTARRLRGLGPDGAVSLLMADALGLAGPGCPGEHLARLLGPAAPDWRAAASACLAAARLGAARLVIEAARSAVVARRAPGADALLASYVGAFGRQGGRR
ncbi:MAG: hypothetical protein LBM66_02165 [Bifidobacteriaceae bacterium]|nr:hypothetical protein [Bifidobacteriaceae bacterium]